MLTHRLNTGGFIAFVLILLVVRFFIPLSGWWFFGVFMVWLTLTSVGSFHIGMNYHLKAYHSGSRAEGKTVALTFDDGPHPLTTEILELLRQHQAKGTFFCIGKQIEKHPDIFRRILEEGHTVGNHSFNHSSSTGFLSQREMEAEIHATNELVERLTGLKMRFYRPPFGVTNPAIQKALTATGHAVIGWSIRSLDTVINSEENILKRIKKRLRPGSIVLMHDTSLKTVHVLKDLLNYLDENHYRAVSTEDLLNLPAYEK